MLTENYYDYSEPKNLQDALNLLETVVEDIWDYLPPEKLDTYETAMQQLLDWKKALQASRRTSRCASRV